MTPEDRTAIAKEVVRLLREESPAASSSEVDWSKVRFPEFTAGQKRPESSNLEGMAAFKLVVLATLNYGGGSMAQLVRTAIAKYIKEKWECGVDNARVIAARENITVEEALTRIADGTLRP